MVRVPIGGWEGNAPEMGSGLNEYEARGLTMQALRRQGWNQVSGLFRIVGDLRARAQGINPINSSGSNGGTVRTTPGCSPVIGTVAGP